MTLADRLLRTIARRLTRSHRLQRRIPSRFSRRGDRLDPQVGVMLWLQNKLPIGFGGDSVASMRAELVRSSWLASPDPQSLPTRESVVLESRVRWYEPPEPVGAIVFLHGGGWVVGDLDSHDPFCRSLALETNRVVVAVDYPLAPEHPFPAAIHQVVEVWKVLHEELRASGIEGAILLGGDSAGANLTTCACLLLRDRGEVLPDRQILLYPGLDPLCRGATHQEFKRGFLLDEDSILRYLKLYAPDPNSPLGCPLDAPDLSGLPPALLTVAGFDPLRDEGLLYAERLLKAGVPVELLDEGSLTHGYINYDGLIDEALRANRRIFDRIREG